jgi:hypothetical protein
MRRHFLSGAAHYNHNWVAARFLWNDCIPTAPLFFPFPNHEIISPLVDRLAVHQSSILTEPA